MTDFDRYHILQPNEVMVVPSHATGSTWDETRRYSWRTSRGRGYCSHDTIVVERERGDEIARDMTRRNVPF